MPTGLAELTYRLINFSVVRRTTDVTRDASQSVDVVLTLALNADVVVTAQGTFRNIADIEDPTASLVGTAAAASQGAVTAAQLIDRPIMRPGETLETVPGLFNAEVSDIDYFYTSRLSDEPAAGIDDIHTHPALPRSFRFGLRLPS